ncbi:MAG TPA: PIN domain-containing protein [Phycisphaerae bacterium]|nr:PIN domain-containing protein [Phycisphaerae bacterium]
MPNVPAYQLDANVLLRFLRNDHKDLSPRAARFIQQANDGKCVLHVSAVTVAEVFYTLKSFYKIQRRVVAQTLASVLNTPAFHLSESHRILDALARVQSSNVDFGDAYIASTAAAAGYPVASFDADLDKFADVTRHEP